MHPFGLLLFLGALGASTTAFLLVDKKHEKLNFYSNSSHLQLNHVYPHSDIDVRVPSTGLAIPGSSQEELNVLDVAKKFNDILSLASNFFPPVGQLSAALSDLSARLETISEQINQRITNVEFLVEYKPFQTSILEKAVKISRHLEGHYNNTSHREYKNRAMRTCKDEDPCTIAHNFNKNYIEDGDRRFIRTYLEKTQYGHQEFVAFRSHLVATMTSLVSSCSLCEKLINGSTTTYSVPENNIAFGSRAGNTTLKVLEEEYGKQQKEFFGKTRGYIEPIVHSRLGKIDDATEAAKELCEELKKKYSIPKDEYRNDNFLCIVTDFATYKAEFRKFQDESSWEDIQDGYYKHFLYYRVSQSESNYNENIQKLVSVRNTFPGYFWHNNDPFKYGEQLSSDFRSLFNKINDVASLPMVFLRYDRDVNNPKLADKQFGQYGAMDGEAVNGNKRAGEIFYIKTKRCKYVMWIETSCDTYDEELRVVFGL